MTCRLFLAVMSCESQTIARIVVPYSDTVLVSYISIYFNMTFATIEAFLSVSIYTYVNLCVIYIYTNIFWCIYIYN